MFEYISSFISTITLVKIFSDKTLSIKKWFYDNIYYSRTKLKTEIINELKAENIIMRTGGGGNIEICCNELIGDMGGISCNGGDYIENNTISK